MISVFGLHILTDKEYGLLERKSNRSDRLEKENAEIRSEIETLEYSNFLMTAVSEEVDNIIKNNKLLYDKVRQAINKRIGEINRLNKRTMPDI